MNKDFFLSAESFTIIDGGKVIFSGEVTNGAALRIYKEVDLDE